MRRLGSRNLADQRFGPDSRLTAIEPAGNNPTGTKLWLCRCDCGGTIVTTSVKLRNGHTRSCGCLLKEYQIRRRQEAERRAAVRKRQRQEEKAAVREQRRLAKIAEKAQRAAEREAKRRATKPRAQKANTRHYSPPPTTSRGWSPDELAAIATAKVTRIENGSWPELGRPEVESRWRGC